MKEQYEVLFQRECEKKEDRWLNGGALYMNQRTFKTLEEAKQCKDLILEKEKRYMGNNYTYAVNGIGITIEYDDETKMNLRLKNIKIRKRLVTKWEDVKEAE